MGSTVTSTTKAQRRKAKKNKNKKKFDSKGRPMTTGGGTAVSKKNIKTGKIRKTEEGEKVGTSFTAQSKEQVAAETAEVEEKKAAARPENDVIKLGTQTETPKKDGGVLGAIEGGLQRVGNVIGGINDKFDLSKQIPDAQISAEAVPVTAAGGALGIVKASQAGRLGSITRTMTNIAKKTSVTTQRAIVGKASKGFKAVEKLFKVSPKTAKVAARFGANSKTGGLTKKFLVGAGLSVAAAAAVREAVGTYPFAGFIKEEALQTLGFAVNAARQAGNLELEQQAIDAINEILNHKDTILEKLPWLNVHLKNKDFYDAAELKNSIDQQILDDRKIQEETGETEEDKWDRINEERKQAEIDAIDYYNEQRKIQMEFERQAKLDQRNEDAAFWKEQRRLQDEQEKKEREATAEFWLNYRKEAAKIQANSRPSNLNFGIL